MKTPTHHPTYHWSILGAGSIGGLWASHLAKAGIQTTLLLRNQQRLCAYRKTPLSLKKNGQEFRPKPQAVAIDEIGYTLDWLLVATKSFAAQSALEAIEGHLNPDTTIVLLTNGLGVQEDIVRRFPAHRIIAGTTTEGVYQPIKYQLVHAGTGETYFGPLSGCNEAVMSRLQQQLNMLELDCFTCDDILTRLWHKVAVNSCINALTIVYSCRNGALLENTLAMQRISKLAGEIEDIMLAEGVSMNAPLVSMVKQVLKKTANNYSSMYQDVANNRKTEIDHINGYLYRRALHHGLNAPENGHLYGQIKELTAGFSH